MKDFFAYYMLVGMLSIYSELLRNKESKRVLDESILRLLKNRGAIVKLIYWIAFPFAIWLSASLWPLFEYNSAKKKWGKTNEG